jgi:SpoVK/Ycf46/Vps4 family AAA+-type ATPase
VKKAIHRTIVLPFQRPDLYERYGRRAGGGVMLFGPPGCGKTLLARATAGECGVPFLNVRIEDVLDPMYGVSERRLHDAFAEARLSAPCVLFLDELDALAYARRKQQGSVGRALVDQLLQELDAIGSDNQGMLILAATNAPWDVDDALKRPGRFDRVVFVSPPDLPARRRILELGLADRPAAPGVDVARLADRTALFSGADLRALVERATDAAIDEALERGDDVPIGQAHLERALGELRPTTVDWLRTARNYVEFANQGGRYDDVLAYLDQRDVKAAVKSR